MGGKLKADEDFPRGIRRIIERQMDHVKSLLSNHRQGGKSIHSARKGIKELRATLRLVREPIGQPSWEELDRLLRKSGRALGRWRDAEVLLGTLEKLLARKPSLAHDKGTSRFNKKLEQKLRKATARLDEARKKSRFRLKEARACFRNCSLKTANLAVFNRGLANSRQLGGDAFDDAVRTRSEEDLHEWRKRTKDLWYQLRVIQRVEPNLTDRTVSDMKKLGALLGDVHDLAMLEEAERLAKAGCKWPASAREWIRAERRKLQDKALELGNRFWDQVGRAT